MARGARPRVPYGDATLSRAPTFWGVMDTNGSGPDGAHDAEARLIDALAADVDAAFPQVVAEHQDRLYTIALRMLGDPHDAEEATQDALVRAYRALAGYETARILDLQLRAWLTTIVLNGCRSRLGRMARRGSASSSLDDVSESAAPRTHDRYSPESIVHAAAERDAWGQRLLGLPPAQRSAVILRHVDGLSYPEMAIALGRPEGTVKAHVHRGIARLRTILEAEVGPQHEEMTA
jgi:RNA polymerase sigma-70 factor (ECF subfamily)